MIKSEKKPAKGVLRSSELQSYNLNDDERRWSSNKPGKVHYHKTTAANTKQKYTS